MELILASLVNAAIDTAWVVLVTVGVSAARTPAASYCTPGLLPSELDLIEVQAGRMTCDEFRARMAARS